MKWLLITVFWTEYSPQAIIRTSEATAETYANWMVVKFQKEDSPYLVSVSGIYISFIYRLFII